LGAGGAAGAAQVGRAATSGSAAAGCEWGRLCTVGADRSSNRASFGMLHECLGVQQGMLLLLLLLLLLVLPGP
jgi:hypothetical protein